MCRKSRVYNKSLNFVVFLCWSSLTVQITVTPSGLGAMTVFLNSVKICLRHQQVNDITIYVKYTVGPINLHQLN